MTVGPECVARCRLQEELVIVTLLVEDNVKEMFTLVAKELASKDLQEVIASKMSLLHKN